MFPARLPSQVHQGERAVPGRLNLGHEPAGHPHRDQAASLVPSPCIWRSSWALSTPPTYWTNSLTAKICSSDRFATPAAKARSTSSIWIAAKTVADGGENPSLQTIHISSHRDGTTTGAHVMTFWATSFWENKGKFPADRP